MLISGGVVTAGRDGNPEKLKSVGVLPVHGRPYEQPRSYFSHSTPFILTVITVPAKALSELSMQAAKVGTPYAFSWTWDTSRTSSQISDIYPKLLLEIHPEHVLDLDRPTELRAEVRP